MTLGTKKPLGKSIFSLTVVSAFVLSTVMGYSAERLDEAGNNVAVHTILKTAAPVTSQVKEIATQAIQQGKKFFISYCWDKSYSTTPMVDDFEQFIQGLGIKEYYRDTRQEKGYGMTFGTNIEDFMKNAKRSDVVVVFLNDSYLRSFNCMREFFQVWNAGSKKITLNALIIRHPDFGAIFARGDAAGLYREHWEKLYVDLLEKAKKIPAADRPRILNEIAFASEVESGITSIVNAIAGHIQMDYSKLRKSGFEDIFKLALAAKVEEEKEGSTARSGRSPARSGRSPAAARPGKSPARSGRSPAARLEIEKITLEQVMSFLREKPETLKLKKEAYSKENYELLTTLGIHFNE